MESSEAPATATTSCPRAPVVLSSRDVEFDGQTFDLVELKGEEWFLVGDLIRKFFASSSRPSIQARIRYSGLKPSMEHLNDDDVARLGRQFDVLHNPKTADTRLLPWKCIADARQRLLPKPGYQSRAKRIVSTSSGPPTREPASPEAKRRRTDRALSRLRSDFHDASPLSIHSITAPNGFRPSAMRPEFKSPPSPPPPPSPIEAKEIDSTAAAAITTTTTTMEIRLQEGDYVPSDLSSLSGESDDPDYSEGIRGQMRGRGERRRRRRQIGARQWKRKRKHDDDDDDNMKEPEMKRRRRRRRRKRLVPTDHAAMKRQYDVLINAGPPPPLSSDKEDKGDSGGNDDQGAKGMKKATARKAKAILHRARKIHIIKQPKGGGTTTTTTTTKSSKKKRPVINKKEAVLTVPRQRQRQRQSQNAFRLDEALPEQPFFHINDEGELSTRNSTWIDDVSRLDDVPGLWHPIWRWRVGRLTAEAPKRLVVRRVQLTSLPVPTRRRREKTKKKKSVVDVSAAAATTAST
ncbi:uncharacterized protein [Oscarella lobularis]|uniref:uncharacterized protein n=1 Tax=Oscarella lobularis TaxID=121494 RepID=UPI0033136A5D